MVPTVISGANNIICVATTQCILLQEFYCRLFSFSLLIDIRNYFESLRSFIPL